MKKTKFAFYMACLMALVLMAMTTYARASGSDAETSAENAPQGIQERPALSQFCGQDNVRVAYMDGYGGNTWRKTTLAELKDEAAECATVELSYFNANGSQSTYVSQVNAAVAQQYDAIITYDDFGEAVLPALKRAYKAGVVVVPFIASVGGTPGVDYAGFVSDDVTAAPKAWAEFMNRATGGKGNLVFLGGTPGDPTSQAYLDAFLDAMKQYPGLTMLTGDTPVTTNYDIAQAQRAMSGLLIKYPEIDGVVAFYSAGQGLGAMQAYISAGVPLPAFAGGSDVNQEVCLWHEYSPTNPDFQIFGSEGATYIGRIALRHAVAAVQGIKDPESWTFERFTGVDTLNGTIPACNKKLPPDADLWSTLPKDKLIKALTDG